MNDILLDSKKTTAVVTGASTGIGFELAKKFAEAGYDLIICAENIEIDEAAAKLRTFGVDVVSLKTDLSEFEGVEKLYEAIRYAKKPATMFALNAGIGVGGSFVNTELEKELKLVRLNIEALIHLSKRILPDLMRQGFGRILFTSSLAAEMPGPYYAVYAASKAFVQSFSEALRFEVKDTGVTITALQPGATETPFFKRAEMLDTPAGRAKKDDPADVAADGFKAMIEGKDHVVAGSFKNSVQATVARFVTEEVAAKMQGSQTKPSSKH